MKLKLVLALSLLWTGSTQAGQVGTITRVEGIVRLLSNPSSEMGGAGLRVKYNGHFYSYKNAVVGDRVQKGNILQTTLEAKARVVYDNGDQFNLGNGTAYTISWNENTDNAEAAQPKVELMYGSLRGVIQKNGPRSRLNVRTRSATMGVRGTDFFIQDKGFGKGTEVSVLRGKVEVKKVEKVADKVVESKPVEVKTGKKAEVVSKAEVQAAQGEVPAVSKAAEAKVAEIQVTQLDKANLVEIHKESFVKQEIAKVDEARAPATQKAVEKLEKRAVETTIKDMKAESPHLVAKLDVNQVQDAQSLNAVVVKEMFKTAPEGKKDVKFEESDFDNLGEDAYQKYFKK